MIKINFLKVKNFFILLSFLLRKHRVKNIFMISTLFENKKGLEIGGPSRFFYKNAPIYQIISLVDGVNFNNITPRDGLIEQGLNHYSYYKKKRGFSYIHDATNLSAISDKKYDVVLSSNCLEHVANPLKALVEWKRVLKDDGLIFLVLPNAKTTFDKKRNITSFDHLLDDYKSNMQEDDLTHFDDVVNNNAFVIDSVTRNKEHFISIAKDNFKYRVIHHHVFDHQLIEKISSYLHFDLIFYGNIKKDDYYILKV